MATVPDIWGDFNIQLPNIAQWVDAGSRLAWKVIETQNWISEGNAVRQGDRVFPREVVMPTLNNWNGSIIYNAKQVLVQEYLTTIVPGDENTRTRIVFPSYENTEGTFISPNRDVNVRVDGVNTGIRKFYYGAKNISINLNYISAVPAIVASSEQAKAALPSHFIRIKTERRQQVYYEKLKILGVRLF